MPEELNPCPICGENKNLMVAKNNHLIAADKPYYIKCGNGCLCAGPTASATAEAAIAAWDAFPRAPHITPNDADCKGCPERQNQGLVWTTGSPRCRGGTGTHKVTFLALVLYSLCTGGLIPTD